MKKITLTLAAIAAAITMNAQTTYFSDDFNDEDVSDWTTYDEDGDGKNWGELFQIGDGAGGFITPVSLISRSWENNVPLTPDNWIVSPAIDLSAEDGTNTILVNWLRQVNDGFPQETYTLYVDTSDDINDLVNSTVSLTESFTAPGPETDTPMDKSLDITQFAGQTVYLAFRHYNSNDADFISIDDVEVVAGSLSTQSQNFEGFNHYVANNVLTLKANTAINNARLYNILGQEVIFKNLGTQSADINLNSLNSGVYLVQVEIEGQSKSFKIVKK